MSVADMREGAALHSYYIINKHSGMVLTQVDYKKEEETATVEQWPIDKARGEDQVWCVFPIDNDCYLMVNKRSGLFLNVAANSRELGKPVQLYPLQNQICSLQMWKLTKEDLGPPIYSCKNAVSDKYLNVASLSDRQGSTINQDILHTNLPERHFQLWEFKVRDTFKAIAPPPPEPVDKLPIIDPVTAKEPENLQSPLVIVGQVIVPYMFVKDSIRTHPVLQLKDNPIYILTRYAYWNMIFFFRHLGGFKINAKMSGIKYGLVSDNASEMEEVLDIKVDKLGNLRISESVEAFYAHTLSERLQTIVCSREMALSEGEMATNIAYGVCAKADAVWCKEDRYELRDVTGKKVLQWIVRRPPAKPVEERPNPFIDTYPKF